MKAGAIIFVVSLVREAVATTATSLFRIISGHPSNELERVAADALRQFLQKMIDRSRLMNPEVP